MGKLHFYCGEMGSGKTARLITDAARAEVEAEESTEITIMKPKLDTIIVDEAQFLSAKQIDQMLELTALRDIDVLAYGLRLNFNLGDENFEGATRLLQIAHDIVILNSRCDICGKRQAIFSCLFKGDKVLRDAPTILISDGQHEVNAKAVCADCYYHSL